MNETTEPLARITCRLAVRYQLITEEYKPCRCMIDIFLPKEEGTQKLHHLLCDSKHELCGETLDAAWGQSALSFWRGNTHLIEASDWETLAQAKSLFENWLQSTLQAAIDHNIALESTMPPGYELEIHLHAHKTKP